MPKKVEYSLIFQDILYFPSKKKTFFFLNTYLFKFSNVFANDIICVKAAKVLK
jgi:hypothetical protein